MPQTLRVMMIDDNEDDFRLLVLSRDALQLTYLLEYRNSGEAGLTGLEITEETNLPDVVLLDMDLPGSPGYEILSRIRADERLKRVIVVMLTGSEAKEDREVCGAADAYVVKPLTLSGWRDLALRIANFAPRGTTPAVSKPSPRPAATVGHILHIDDDQDDRKLFTIAFAKSGLGGILHSLTGSAEALLYLNQMGPYAGAQRPILIILDLSLPRLGGLGLLEMLSTNPRFKTIPVIILTGSENFADMQRCRDLGVTDFIVKPRTSQEMVELLASFAHWLNKSSLDSPIG